jgi:hypothetical protein
VTAATISPPPGSSAGPTPESSAVDHTTSGHGTTSAGTGGGVIGGVGDGAGVQASTADAIAKEPKRSQGRRIPRSVTHGRG